MGAWCKHNILWFFLNKNKNWTKCRLISKKSVLYRDCSHEDSPSLNGNLSFLTQFLLLPLKFSPFLWRHMASAECYCGSPRPHNAVQVRRMPPSVYSCSQVAKATDFDSVIRLFKSTQLCQENLNERWVQKCPEVDPKRMRTKLRPPQR